MQIKDYDFINNIDVLFEKKIFIYGAGRYGRRIAELLDDAGIGGGRRVLFCDRNESPKECMGHPVISLNELEKRAKQEDCMIVIGSKDYCEEMIEELDKRKIEAYVCTWYGLQAGIEINIDDGRFLKEFQTDFIYRKEISKPCKQLRGIIEQWIDICKKPHALCIYQAGKVGSSTVYNTLHRSGMDIVRANHIVNTYMTEDISKLRSYIIEKYKSKGGKFITLVREPIARALSEFMQRFGADGIRDQLEDGEDLAARACKYIKEELGDNFVFHWFDEEMKVVTGIDIYQYPFDKEKGYAWIKEGNIEILVLKMEKLNENASVLGEFVGQPDIELCNRNVGSEKHYKYIYDELKKKIKLSVKVLDSQYKENRKLDHFYTEEEKEQFRLKWSAYVD